MLCASVGCRAQTKAKVCEHSSSECIFPVPRCFPSSISWKMTHIQCHPLCLVRGWGLPHTPSCALGSHRGHRVTVLSWSQTSWEPGKWEKGCLRLDVSSLAQKTKLQTKGARGTPSSSPCLTTFPMQRKNKPSPIQCHHLNLGTEMPRDTWHLLWFIFPSVPLGQGICPS